MDKGNIIRMSLLRLGKNNAYNDNKSDEYTVAEELIEHIVETLAKDTAYLFNSTTVQLSKFSSSVNSLGENSFNKPVDYLNLIRCNVDVRDENEFLYSKSDEIILQYNRKITIENIPDFAKDLLIYHLCYELCLAFNSWFERMPIFESKIREERAKIIANQYNNFSFGG